MKKRRKQVRRGKSIKGGEATVAYATDTAKYLTEIAERAAAYAASARNLSVPVAATEKEFLKKAKQVYRETYTPSGRPGRRSEENLAIVNLSKFEHKLRRIPTQGEMIKALMKLNLSKNTAGKYAKLYRLSKQHPDKFSHSDQQWLCKHFGKEALADLWWMDRHWEWWAEGARRSGLMDEIRNMFLKT